MTLSLQQKKAIVREVKEAASSALSLISVDFRGMNVAEMTEIRNLARDAGVQLRVVRNTLTKRALEDTEHACLNDTLAGPSMLAFSPEEPSAVARLLRDYAKQCQALQVRAISIAGQLHGGEDLEKIASLPTRDEGIATLMSTMMAPVSGLARTLKEVPSKLVRTLSAIRERKESHRES